MMTDALANEDTLTLPRNKAALQAFAEWLDRRVDGLSLPPKTAYALRLCLEEAVMNTYYHARSDGVGDHPIRVWVGIRDGAPSAWVEDDGPPFDPVEASLPEKPTSLAGAAIGGAGLRLMRYYARRMNYRRIDARNRLEMTFEA
jgi:serine/threonine-protein kinase RsbW